MHLRIFKYRLRNGGHFVQEEMSEPHNKRTSSTQTKHICQPTRLLSVGKIVLHFACQSNSNIVFACVLMHCDKKPRQNGFSHDNYKKLQIYPPAICWLTLLISLVQTNLLLFSIKKSTNCCYHTHISRYAILVSIRCFIITQGAHVLNSVIFVYKKDKNLSIPSEECAIEKIGLDQATVKYAYKKFNHAWHFNSETTHAYIATEKKPHSSKGSRMNQDSKVHGAKILAPGTFIQI